MRYQSIILSLHLFLILPFLLQSQPAALERLENSTRHHEWVLLEADGQKLWAFVAYPERAEPSGTIIIIHENRGLTDWVRSMADELAEWGYLALAPDLLSFSQDGIEKTSDFATSDDARNAIYQLDPEQVLKNLDASFNYLKEDPASNGQVSVMGFCWGGAQTWRYACHQPQLENALVFYGGGPKEMESLRGIQAPVFGFYGENDQRVNAGIPTIEKAMKDLNKDFDYSIYPGAGHAYLRQASMDTADEASKTAAQQSRDRIKKILSGN